MPLTTRVTAASIGAVPTDAGVNGIGITFPGQQTSGGTIGSGGTVAGGSVANGSAACAGTCRNITAVGIPDAGSGMWQRIA
jgi:hypothetical protein